ncbi:EAL domain-containing protein [Sphingomonas ginkgonis]|uniref:EAL domain-containing protein n=1 Tax=Sphingomonas ginkgonis TaxID=2315330 RepID=A0A3S0EKA0_9SPHN|nr:EAL domain-containing protein [Sphingomonas ginkgonis]RST29594.1 EAL domain-containing protein [Sphingomonas ginkgonis]
MTHAAPACAERPRCGIQISDSEQEALCADPSLRVNSILVGIGSIIAAALALLTCVMLVGYNQSMRLGYERERQQVENGFARRLGELRADLASVTFWDEAVERTAIRRDRAWAEDNIGQWLAQFYGVDQSFLVDGRGQLWLAFENGRPAPARRYHALEPRLADLLRSARARSDRLADERRPSSSGFAVSAGSNLADSRLMMVDGQPSYVIATPILPDFGRVAQPVDGYMMLVAVHRIDPALLHQLSAGLLVKPLHLQRVSEPYREAEGHFVLPVAGLSGGDRLELRWHRDGRGRDLMLSALPLLAVLMALFILVAVLGVRHVRRATGNLLVSRFEANHDELTRLPNRRLLTRRLADHLAHDEPIALMFIDLDRFKQVNDLWGHAEGDRVIRHTAARLRTAVGEGVVARFGGDEFVVLLTGSADEAERIGRNILIALREPYQIMGKPVTLAGSVGIALAPFHGRQPGELMRKADLALYRAKSLGRNRMVIFDSAMDAALQERQQLELELRNAIRDDCFNIVYQPQVCRVTGRIAGVEALARWTRPDGRPVEPSLFITIAEEAGIVSELDALVLRQACREASGWHELVLAVNVSPQELRTPHYAKLVRDVLAESGLPPQRLRLEITETALLEDKTMVAYTVRELSRLGVRFTLDDFGTGYSSLDHLRTLQLEGMKIDRSFVADLGREPESITLITSIIALGHALGLSVTAEGVETKQQLALLRAAGCDEFQGYLFGHPVSAEELRRRLRLPRAA